MQPLQEERPSGQTEAGQWPLSTKTMASSASPGNGKRTTSQLPLPSPASLPQIPSPSGNKGSELNTRPEAENQEPAGLWQPLPDLHKGGAAQYPFSQPHQGGGVGGGRGLFSTTTMAQSGPPDALNKAGCWGAGWEPAAQGQAPLPARITQWPADQAASTEGGAGSPGHVCSKPRDRAAGRAGARDE